MESFNTTSAGGVPWRGGSGSWALIFGHMTTLATSLSWCFWHIRCREDESQERKPHLCVYGGVLWRERSGSPTSAYGGVLWRERSGSPAEQLCGLWPTCLLPRAAPSLQCEL